LLEADRAFEAAGRKDFLAEEDLRANLAELYRRRNQPEKAVEFEP
jgi:hypothetical protein